MNLRAPRLLRTSLPGNLLALSVSRAALVGLANTSTDWVVFVALLQSGSFSGTQGVLAASALSYAVGICQSFILSSRWVYSRGKPIELRRVFSFLFVALLGLGITTEALWVLPSLLSVAVSNSAVVLGLARVSGLGVAFVTTYWLNKYLVFGDGRFRSRVR